MTPVRDASVDGSIDATAAAGRIEARGPYFGIVTRRRPPMLVSIVIPTFNSRAFLDQQLESLTRQDYEGEFEVILADNGSTDGTPAMAVTWRDRLPIRVVDASDQRSIGYATNVGAFCARGELIVCTDHDDVAAPQWLRALVEAALTADLVGGPDECQQLNSSKALAARHWTPPLREPPTILAFLPSVFTNNFAIWADVLAALGGFREDYGPGGDIHLCWRAQLASYRLGFAPDAIMHYRYRDNLRDLVSQQYGYGRAGVQLFQDFRGYGLRRMLGRGLLEWFFLALRIPFLVVPRRRLRWIGDVAFRLGRIGGCLEHRCVFL
jgi:glycosyltransferase involved in cell wall biosynthesis